MSWQAGPVTLAGKHGIGLFKSSYGKEIELRSIGTRRSVLHAALRSVAEGPASHRGACWRKLRRHALLLGVCGVTLLTELIGSPNALAINYYYGIAVLNGNSFLGTDLSMRVNCLYDPQSFVWAGRHIDQDSWVGDNAGHWIEAGIMQGNSGGGVGVFARVPAFFWGDLRPNSQFYIHLGGAATLNTYYDDNIRYAGNQTWNVDVGGFTGSSYPNITYARGIETGLEETDQNSEAYGSSSSMAYYDSQGNYHSGWYDSSNGNAYISDANSPLPSAYWMSQNNWIRDYNSSTTCPIGSAPTLSSGPKLGPSRLISIATALAQGAGDSTPSAIQTVETTRAQAVWLASAGDRVAGGEDVFLISMKGQFTASGAPRPPGTKPPSGSALTLVVDAYTGAVTDWGLAQSAPNLGVLGHPQPLG